MQLTEPVVISPTIDAATVESTLWLYNSLRASDAPLEVEHAHEIAAEHLRETFANYAPALPPERWHFREAATDAELLAVFSKGITS